MTSGDPHCGWSRQVFRCVSLLNLRGLRASGLNFNVDVKTRPQCPSSNLPHVESKVSGWSLWRPCLMTNDLHPKTKKATPDVQRSCLCRICLSETLCNFAEQQVSQCKGNLNGVAILPERKPIRLFFTTLLTYLLDFSSRGVVTLVKLVALSR